MKGEVTSGSVISYNSHESRKYGFLRVSGRKKDLFFHFTDARHFVASNGEVMPALDGPIRHPRVGDILVFQTHTSKEGRERAVPWGYQEEYESALQEIRKEPA